MSEALAALSILVKPLYTEINNRPYVIFKGTPVPHGLFIAFIGNKMPSSAQQTFDLMVGKPQPYHFIKDNLIDEMIMFRKMGYVVPETLLILMRNDYVPLRAFERHTQAQLPIYVHDIFNMVQDINEQKSIYGKPME